MRGIRFFGLAVVAVLAIGIVAASSAAAAPEFKPSTNQRYTGTSGAATLEGGVKINCKSNKSTGRNHRYELGRESDRVLHRL